MNEVIGAERVLSPPRASVEIAGALQGVFLDLESRDYVPDIQQVAAIEAIGLALLTGETSGYIEMPTSTGKTLIESLLAEAAVRAGKRVLILTPSVQVAEQLNGKNGQKGLGRFTDLHDTESVSQHYGGKHGTSDAPVVISTYLGLVAEAKRQDSRRLGEFDVIIGDECHRSLGTATSRVMETYMPDALKIGFSATPDYAVDRTSEELYGKSLFEYSLLDAVLSGKTAAVKPMLYRTRTTLEISDLQKDFTSAELAPLIKDVQRNGSAIQITADLVLDGRQGIIACVPGNQNAHARMMAHMLNQTGVDGRMIVAADIGAHIPPIEQRRRLHAYHNGEIDVLTFTRALEEGWDSDRASFCLNLAPTTSPVRTTQLLGRTLRPKADGKESIYVDFVDEKSGISKEQYTAFHALGLEQIDVRRVLGRQEYSPTQSRYDNPTDISQVLRPEVYARFMQSHGRLLREVLVTRNEQGLDPLVVHWNKVLAREGFEEEPRNNSVLTPKIARELERRFRMMTERNGVEPTLVELIEAMQVPLMDKEGVLANYALRVAFDDDQATVEMAQRDTETGIQQVRKAALEKAMGIVLGSLLEREEGIIKLRFGFMHGSPRRLDEIAEVYSITREGARQTEGKALSKLRHASRSRSLREFLPEEGYLGSFMEPFYLNENRNQMPDEPKVPSMIDIRTAVLLPPQEYVSGKTETGTYEQKITLDLDNWTKSCMNGIANQYKIDGDYFHTICSMEADGSKILVELVRSLARARARPTPVTKAQEAQRNITVFALNEKINRLNLLLQYVRQYITRAGDPRDLAEHE